MEKRAQVRTRQELANTGEIWKFCGVKSESYLKKHGRPYICYSTMCWMTIWVEIFSLYWRFNAFSSLYEQCFDYRIHWEIHILKSQQIPKIDMYKNKPPSEAMTLLQATSRLLLLFHAGSVTQKPTKFDLSTLILFIWGRKWGAESGEEQLALGTTQTKHLQSSAPAISLHTQWAFFSPLNLFCIQPFIFCTYAAREWHKVRNRGEERGKRWRRKC